MPLIHRASARAELSIFTDHGICLKRWHAQIPCDIHTHRWHDMARHSHLRCRHRRTSATMQPALGLWSCCACGVCCCLARWSWGCLCGVAALAAGCVLCGAAWLPAGLSGLVSAAVWSLPLFHRPGFCGSRALTYRRNINGGWLVIYRRPISGG